MGSLAILLVALIVDWVVGDPDFIWRRLPHPVVWFGKAVGFVDRTLNKETDAPLMRYRKGAVGISVLVILAAVIGWLIDGVLGEIKFVGTLIEIGILFVFLAQKSLIDHVAAVSTGLSNSGLEGGRKAVAMIVGRDPNALDHNGICRASIESLAENFSDGVVAPAFWYLIFGLPGLFAYKMINTADSMIAYRNEKYLWFGREAARFDDFANWLPARLSAAFIAIGALVFGGVSAMRHSVFVALRDSGLHRSPNAGWPEAAMAGAIGIALGGPRIYGGETVSQAYLNPAGRRRIDRHDINRAIACFSRACFALWGSVLVLALIF